MPELRPTQPTLLQLAGPLIISFWMRAAVTFVDTIYASLIGDAAVAAIGLAVPFEFLMIAVWVGLSTGLTSNLSRAMGAREGLQIEQYVKSCWRLIALFSPAFALLGAGIWLFTPLVNLEPPTAAAFRVYGSVLIGGSAFTTFWSVVPDSLVKAHQDTRSTMWAGICTNGINLVLNTYFLFVLEWGIFGIALSTVLGRIGGLAYALRRARHHEELRRATSATPGRSVDKRPFGSLLLLAIPASMTFALVSMETALVNGLLAAMEHATEAIAAYSIYYRVVLFALQPIIATSVAVLPFASRRFGAGDVAGVRRGMRQAWIAVSLYSLGVLGPLMLAGGPQFAAWLSESDLTRAYATFAMRVVPLACFASAPFLLCRPVFEAMSRGRPGLVMAVLRYLVLTVPSAWIGVRLARAAGSPALFGMVWGLLAAATLSSLIFLLWLYRALPAQRAPAVGVHGDRR